MMEEKEVRVQKSPVGVRICYDRIRENEGIRIRIWLGHTVGASYSSSGTKY